MKAKQEVIVQEREKQLAKKLKEKEKEIERELEAKKAEKAKQKKQIQTLSFQLDEEEEDSDSDKPSSHHTKPVATDEGSQDSNSSTEPLPKKMKGNKNPDVDTSFLPDRYFHF